MNTTTTILRTVEVTECLHKLDEYQNKLLNALKDLPIDVTLKILYDLAKLHMDSHARVNELLDKLTANNK